MTGLRSSVWAFTLGLAFASATAAQIPLGPALPANGSHDQDQNAPNVAMAQDGTAVLVYSGDGYGRRLVRWLDGDGSAYGPEARLRVDPETGGLFQDLAVTRQGNGAACWEDPYWGFGVCRILDTRGRLGDREIRCSDDIYHFADREFGPRVETFDDGSFVVSWLEYVAPEFFSRVGTESVTVRYFSAEGLAMGSAISLEQTLEGQINPPDVASLADGHAAVVWPGETLDSEGSGIRARIVDKSGVIGPPILVNSYQAGDQKSPDIASNRKDRFVVAWESNGQDGSGAGVYGQLFDDHGTKIGGEFQVSSNAFSWQGEPAVSMDRSGRFVVAFYSDYETDDRAQDILLRAYRADGTPLGPQVFVSEADTDPLDYPAVSLSESGLVQVAFKGPWFPPEDPDGNFDILTRRFVLPCEGDAYTLCLSGGRFAVRAFWRNRDGAEDLATRIPLSPDTGGFYFFDPTNFELLVKVLDGCAINQHFWVFAAGLTDVEVDVLVTDTFTGEVQTYHNPQGAAFAPVQDIAAFGGCAVSAPAGSAAAAAERAAEPILPEPAAEVASSPLCVAAPDVLCLGGGRFRVKAQWADFLGQSGPAFARPQSGNSGLFYFFGADNLELAVKVLDGCALNGHFWVYAAGLTNVEVRLTVEDLASGSTWQRSTALGTAFPPLLDSVAFSACP